MNEQEFLEAIKRSMQESEQQLKEMGRPVSCATREEALQQVRMLQEAKAQYKATCYG